MRKQWWEKRPREGASHSSEGVSLGAETITRLRLEKVVKSTGPYQGSAKRDFSLTTFKLVTEAELAASVPPRSFDVGMF